MARTTTIRRLPPRPRYETDPILSWEELPVICTCADVAHLLFCTVEQVQRMAARGDLPAFRLGKEWRLRKEDVLAYIEAQVTGGGGESDGSAE